MPTTMRAVAVHPGRRMSCWTRWCDNPGSSPASVMLSRTDGGRRVRRRRDRARYATSSGFTRRKNASSTIHEKPTSVVLESARRGRRFLSGESRPSCGSS